MYLVLQPYFADVIDMYEYDEASEAQNQFIINVLKEAFNAPNLDYQNEDGMFYLNLADDENMNVVNIVNNIRAETGNLDIAGAEGRQPRLMFQIVENDEMDNEDNNNNNNNIGQEGGRKRRRRTNKKKTGGKKRRTNKKHKKGGKKTYKKRKTNKKGKRN